MPEELESEQGILDTPETVTESKVEAEEESRVPVSVVKELREELRQAKEDGNLTRRQMTQLMSQYQESLRSNKPMEPEADLDPEVLKLLRPYLKPVQEELSQTRRELEAIKAGKQQSDAERYIEKNLPNLSEIREDLIKELSSYSQEEQAEIYSNPREVVRIGKMLTKLKFGTTAAKGESRSRARSESGSTSTRPDAENANVDAKVEAWMKANGFK